MEETTGQKWPALLHRAVITTQEVDKQLCDMECVKSSCLSLPVFCTITPESTCVLYYHTWVYLYSVLSHLSLPVFCTITPESTCILYYHTWVYLYSVLSHLSLPVFCTDMHTVCQRWLSVMSTYTCVSVQVPCSGCGRCRSCGRWYCLLSPVMAAAAAATSSLLQFVLLTSVSSVHTSAGCSWVYCKCLPPAW